MSLDVYLRLKNVSKRPQGSGIFVREDGATKEISREEWDAKFPDREPHVANIEDDDDEVFSRNITHNLGKMAAVAGIYEALWRPEEINVTLAGQLAGRLAAGLTELKSDPRKYKAYNPENGWGKYENLVEFVEAYLEACTTWPLAEVSVSR